MARAHPEPRFEWASSPAGATARGAPEPFRAMTCGVGGTACFCLLGLHVTQHVARVSARKAEDVRPNESSHVPYAPRVIFSRAALAMNVERVRPCASAASSIA